MSDVIKFIYSRNGKKCLMISNENYNLSNKMVYKFLRENSFSIQLNDELIELRRYIKNISNQKLKDLLKELIYYPTKFSACEEIDKVNIKILALYNIFDLIKISSFFYNKYDINGRHASYNIDSFDNRFAYFFVNGHYYKVYFSIAIMNSRKLIYAISKIIEIARF